MHFDRRKGGLGVLSKAQGLNCDLFAQMGCGQISCSSQKSWVLDKTPKPRILRSTLPKGQPCTVLGRPINPPQKPLFALHEAFFRASVTAQQLLPFSAHGILHLQSILLLQQPGSVAPHKIYKSIRNRVGSTWHPWAPCSWCLAHQAHRPEDPEARHKDPEARRIELAHNANEQGQVSRDG